MFNIFQYITQKYFLFHENFVQSLQTLNISD